ncbi:MAG TPA: ABC transporter permease [Gammaproteobacteria bacterium]
MGTAWIVFLKECRDNLRDRRTLFMALLVGPVLGPVMFVGLMKAGISRSMEGAGELPAVVIGAEHAPNLVQHLREQGAEIEQSDAQPEALVKEDKERVVLVIPADIGAHYREARPATLQMYFDRSERSAERRAQRLERMLNVHARQLGLMRLQARGIAPEVTLPYYVESIDLSTPMSRAAIFFSMLPYFLFLATIMGAFYLAIDTTAGERERGSLESLLGLPLSRAGIVLGKVAAAVVFSSLSMLLTVIAFALAFPQLDLSALGINTALTPGQIAGILAVTFPFAVFSAGMLTLVASYAKSYKEAQTYLSIVMLVPVIPVAVGAMMSPEISAGGVLVPAFGQHLLIMEIIKGNNVPALYLLYSAGATLAAGALMTLAAIGLYRSERILG